MVESAPTKRDDTRCYPICRLDSIAIIVKTECLRKLELVVLLWTRQRVVRLV
jgi:hypothetical protein